MVSTGCISPPAQMSYCRVHRRVWIEEYHDWVACLEPPSMCVGVGKEQREISDEISNLLI